MSGAILTTSEMGKPVASCVMLTLGAVVAVPTDGYWNETGTRFNTCRVPGFSITRKSEHYCIQLAADYSGYNACEVNKTASHTYIITYLTTALIKNQAKYILPPPNVALFQ